MNNLAIIWSNLVVVHSHRKYTGSLKQKRVHEYNAKGEIVKSMQNLPIIRGDFTKLYKISRESQKEKRGYACGSGKDAS